MEYGLKNVLRFYDKKEKQNRYYGYVNGNLRTWRLYCDVYLLLSFQIEVSTSASDFVVNLVDADDETSVNITSYFDTTGTDANLYLQTFDDFKYLIYNRSKNLTSTIPQGIYYLHVVCGGSNYYSEVFHVSDLSDKLIIDYYHSSDIDGIDYTNGDYAQFSNKLVVDTKLNRPRHEYEEDGTEDGEGEFLPTFQKIVKRYRFIFYAPEYIVDAVMLLPLHDTINVATANATNQNENLTNTKSWVVDVDWNDTKGFAKITCEFHTEAITLTPCANNVT